MVKKIKPSKAFGQLPASLEGLGRRKVRYWCFRFRTEAEGGPLADEAPQGVREHFESLDWFKGWATFNVEWDVHDTDYGRIVPLDRNPLDVWNAEAYGNAKLIPKTE